MSPASDVVIVGGGLAGLACGKTLTERGIACTVLEASDRIGGQAQTDTMDGFLLDRGFQVFLTAYPEAQRHLNYKDLHLRPFFSGSLVRLYQRFYTVADPRRHPWRGFVSLFNSIGTIRDKWLVLKLLQQAASRDFSDDCPPSSRTLNHLIEDMGFSREITTRFFRPFFGGVFSDPHLETSQSIFEFVFSMFGKGLTTVPAQGMSAIAAQLATTLPPESIRTHSKVRSVKSNEVVLESGEILEGRAVVIATEQQEAGRLTHQEFQYPKQQTYCLYFSAKEPPLRGPFLTLNGEGKGPINHLSVISQVAPTYAPREYSLISVTVLNHGGSPANLEDLVRQQLLRWFGIVVKDWRHLKTYSIQRSIQRALPPSSRWPGMKQDSSNIFLCGDYFHSPTHHGALVSGRKTGESVSDFLNK